MIIHSTASRSDNGDPHLLPVLSPWAWPEPLSLSASLTLLDPIWVSNHPLLSGQVPRILLVPTMWVTKLGVSLGSLHMLFPLAPVPSPQMVNVSFLLRFLIHVTSRPRAVTHSTGLELSEHAWLISKCVHVRVYSLCSQGLACS